MCAQVALWLYQKSAGYSKSAVTERAAAMLNTSGMDGDDLDRYTTLVWNIYSGAQNRTHSYYIFHSDNSNSRGWYRPQHYPRLTFIPTEAGQRQKGEERPEAEKKAVNMRQAALQPVYLTV